MNNYSNRANLFYKTLQDKEMEDSFEKIEKNDAIGYQIEQNMKNGRCLILVVFDESIFVQVLFSLCQLENVGKKEKMLSLLNDLSQEYKTLKFYLTDNYLVQAQFNYTAPDDNFDSELLYDIIVDSYKNIENSDYAKIMRVLWS